MMRLWAVAALVLGVCRGEDSDSLRGALEAINRRQRDLADPTLYYLEHFRPAAVRLMYPRHDDGDGQPEDIGYGYQKSLAGKTAGVFDEAAVPESELGSHDPGVITHSPDGKALENIIMSYLEDNMATPVGLDTQRFNYPNQNVDFKRSVFRERDINDLPDTLQNLYPDGESPDQFFENGEHPRTVPSPFRERFSSKPSRTYPTLNAQALVRNFGGLNRDTEKFPGNDEDPDEYESLLNSVWEKYQNSNPDGFDPEDLSESDVEEILDYINHKEERKRQHENSYESGYDFFNSPLAWVKRDRQRLNENYKPPSDQFLHALKFLNSHTDVLESMREEDIPDDERDVDVAKLLLEERQRPKYYKQHQKRFWRGNTYEEHSKHIAKRYPIAKRSSSYYTSPAALYHKVSTDKFNQRKKKNIKSTPSDGVTDPKIARELNDIFSASDNKSKPKNDSELSNESQSQNQSKSKNSSNTLPTSITTKSNSSKTAFDQMMSDQLMGTHHHRKRSGQKEETTLESQHKPLEVSKKSVDWSTYFGIDKRRKKSTIKPSNDEWLLDQYLKAYSISARINDNGDKHNEKLKFDIDKKSSDDMDAKLRAMEDMIVDQALKYTGAHEGVTDSDEVQSVKDRVIAQLAAAYSLEKMRKALSEFKSSMAAQQASAPSRTTTDAPEAKDKRVAVKKEKAEVPTDEKLEKKGEMSNSIGVIHPADHSHSGVRAPEGSCPIMDEITQKCEVIDKLAEDSSETLVPLCSLHQVCYLCGSDVGVTSRDCDASFLSEADTLCGENLHCRYTVRRMLSTMHSLHSDPSPLSCDWLKHPCIPHFLSMIVG